MATRQPAAPVRKVAKKTPARKQAARKTSASGPTAPAATVAKPVVTAAPGDTPKQKLVRDSFTMPKAEYDVIATLKARLVHLERPTKKGELIRAGIAALAAMDDTALRVSVERIPSLKTGRPKKAKGDSSKAGRKSAP